MTTPLLPAPALATLQQLSLASLPHRADRQAAVRTRGDGGVYTTARSTVATALPCRLAPESPPAPTPGADGQGVETSERYLVALPAGTAIAAGDWLVITHDLPNVASPLTLQVDAVPIRTAEMDRRVRASRPVAPEVAT